jgi:collagen type VII alpha
VQQAATVNTPAHQHQIDSDSGPSSPREDESIRGSASSQDSSHGSAHHSGGFVSGGTAGQNGSQNAHGVTTNGQRGAPASNGLDSARHGSVTSGHGNFGGAPQADTGTQVDGRSGPSQPSHQAAPQADLGNSTASGVSGQSTQSVGAASQPSHISTPSSHGSAPATADGSTPSAHPTATPQTTPTTHTTAPGTPTGSASIVHSTPTTHSTAPATVHSSDPGGGVGSSSSHGLSSGLTTHDSGQAATPAVHDTTHPTTDHTAVPH